MEEKRVFNIKGSYVDIHDNQTVNLHLSGAKVDVEQSNKTVTAQRAGRRVNDFSSCITASPKEATLAKLHTLIDGKPCREAAMMIQAGIKAGLITRPIAASVINEFGIQCSVSAFNTQMRIKSTDEELEPIIKGMK